MPQNHLKEIHNKVPSVALRLWQRNMLASCDGNISYRHDSGEISITPSGVEKAFMRPEDMILIDINGLPLDPKQKRQPSSEMSMHLTVYKHCPEARAVIHAHPPYAIAWSIANPNLDELPSECFSELILACGKIPFVPYATPSSPSMGENLIPFLKQGLKNMILRRHGALCWGDSLEEALRGMERLEHAAHTLYLSKTLGRISDLPSEEIQRLKKMREKMGDRTL